MLYCTKQLTRMYHDLRESTTPLRMQIAGDVTWRKVESEDTNISGKHKARE